MIASISSDLTGKPATTLPPLSGNNDFTPQTHLCLVLITFVGRKKSNILCPSFVFKTIKQTSLWKMTRLSTGRQTTGIIMAAHKPGGFFLNFIIIFQTSAVFSQVFVTYWPQVCSCSAKFAGRLPLIYRTHRGNDDDGDDDDGDNSSSNNNGSNRRTPPTINSC